MKSIKNLKIVFGNCEQNETDLCIIRFDSKTLIKIRLLRCLPNPNCTIEIGVLITQDVEWSCKKC